MKSKICNFPKMSIGTCLLEWVFILAGMQKTFAESDILQIAMIQWSKRSHTGVESIIAWTTMVMLIAIEECFKGEKLKFTFWDNMQCHEQCISFGVQEPHTSLLVSNLWTVFSLCKFKNIKHLHTSNYTRAGSRVSHCIISIRVWWLGLSSLGLRYYFIPTKTSSDLISCFITLVVIIERNC